MVMRPGHLYGVSSMKPKQRGFGLIPPLSPLIPPLSPMLPPMPPPLPPPPMPIPPPTPSPTPTPPTIIYPYQPYPSYYSPYPSYPSDLEMEFARPRRRRPKEEEAPKEVKPKTLAQHIKEWLAGK